MLGTQSLFVFPAFLLYDCFMYIFGELAQEASVSNGLTDVKLRSRVKSELFHSPEYYSRAYTHLSSIRNIPFSMDLHGYAAGVNYSANAGVDSSVVQENKDLKVLIGREMLSSLRHYDTVMLDYKAKAYLTKEFSSRALFRVKIEGKTYRSWEDFANFDVTRVSAATSKIECSMKMTFVNEKMVKKVIRGKLEFHNDRWGFHPVKFTPNGLYTSRGAYIDPAQIVMNKIFRDRHERRKLAEEYLQIAESELMSFSTFQKSMDELMPFVQNGNKPEASVFNALCGGRTPSETRLIFKASSNIGGKELRIKVFRCFKCGVPIGMKMERPYPYDWAQQSESASELHKAIERGSRIISEGHGGGAC